MNIMNLLRKSNWIVFDKIKNLSYSEEEKAIYIKTKYKIVLKKNKFIKLEEPKCLLNKNKSKRDVIIIDKYNQDYQIS